MSTFSSGDIVRLKSGGPKMTVLSVEGEASMRCQWFDRNGKLHTDSFQTVMLDAFVQRPPEY